MAGRRNDPVQPSVFNDPFASTRMLGPHRSRVPHGPASLTSFRVTLVLAIGCPPAPVVETESRSFVPGLPFHCTSCVGKGRGSMLSASAAAANSARRVTMTQKYPQRVSDVAISHAPGEHADWVSGCSAERAHRWPLRRRAAVPASIAGPGMSDAPPIIDAA